MRKIIKFIQSPLSIDSFIRSFETGTWDDRAKFIVVIVWTCDCIDDDYSRITRAHLIKHQNKLPVETEKHVFTKVNNENDNADFHDIKVAPRSRALLTSASLSDYSGWRQTKQQRRAPKMNIDMIRTNEVLIYVMKLNWIIWNRLKLLCLTKGSDCLLLVAFMILYIYFPLLPLFYQLSPLFLSLLLSWYFCIVCFISSVSASNNSSWRLAELAFGLCAKSVSLKMLRLRNTAGTKWMACTSWPNAIHSETKKEKQYSSKHFCCTNNRIWNGNYIWIIHGCLLSDGFLLVVVFLFRLHCYSAIVFSFGFCIVCLTHSFCFLHLLLLMTKLKTSFAFRWSPRCF